MLPQVALQPNVVTIIGWGKANEMGLFRRLVERHRAAKAHMVSEIHNRAGVLPPDLEKQVAAVKRIALNLFQNTAYPTSTTRNAQLRRDANVPFVLTFHQPDSRFRYLIFCLSAVYVVCGHRMKDPDGVLKECADQLFKLAGMPEGRELFDGPIDQAKVVKEGTAHLREYLDRWPAYFELRAGAGGRTDAATTIVCAMLRRAESSAPLTESDRSRLLPLACWIEESLGSMQSAFVEASR